MCELMILKKNLPSRLNFAKQMAVNPGSMASSKSIICSLTVGYVDWSQLHARPTGGK